VKKIKRRNKMNTCGDCPHKDACIRCGEDDDLECPARKSERNIIDKLYEALANSQSQEEWKSFYEIFNTLEEKGPVK